MAMFPYDHPDAYAKIVLGNFVSPGTVTLSGHDRFENWDTQEAKGSQGATSDLDGKPIGRFQASFFLASREDFELWGMFQQLIESMTNGPRPVALPVYHPDLAINGFTEVSSGGVGGMLHDGRNGAQVIVKFIEYRPPKPKQSQKAKASAGTGTRQGTTTLHKPDPNIAAKQELSGLLDEASEP